MIDVQSSKVTSRFKLESTGVAKVKYPMRIKDGPDGRSAAALVEWRLGVALAADVRGAHMSRFMEELHAVSAGELDLDGTLAFARRLKERLDVGRADVEGAFSWFREVAAPVSGRTAFLDSTISFFAESGDQESKGLTIELAVKSVCPCSKAISDHGAHNQRSTLKARLTLAADSPAPNLDRLIGLLETSGSSPVYPILKREDEKFITESAYDNPVFVEDLARRAAERLADLPGLVRLDIEAMNHESIHRHDVFAVLTLTPALL